VGDMDDLPDAPTMIPINIPDAPSMTAIPVPERPDIDTTVEIPDAPQIAMPDMEALEQIRLPEFVFPELPRSTPRRRTRAGSRCPTSSSTGWSRSTSPRCWTSCKRRSRN
ncbi:hypothetical protein MNU23_31630, partial [Pseudomonas aeruginosa]|nr:hypothetical protein [Pseudomonas aeruginosa]